MTDDPQRKARLLTEAFIDSVKRNYKDGPGTSGRKVVPIDILLGYLESYFKIIPQEHINAESQPIHISNIYLHEHFTIPPGIYPELILSGSEFSKGLCLDGIIFKGRLHISNIPSPKVTMKKAICEGNVDFKHSRIDGTVELSSTTIKEIYKGRFQCDSPISISRTTIEKLEGTTFQSDVHIHTNLGCNTLNFVDCKFLSKLSIDGGGSGSSPSRLIFDICVHTGDVSFSRVYLSEGLHISNSTIEKVFSLRSCVIEDSLIIENSIFTTPPQFIFEKDENLTVNTHFKNNTFTDYSTRDALTWYRVLRRLAKERLRSASDEALFFACEQRTQANLWMNQKGHKFAAILSKAYDLISAYGQSTFRPIGWFFFIFSASWAIFAVACYMGNMIGRGDNVLILADYPSLGLAIQNVVAPFTFFSRQAAFVPTSIFTVVVSIIQTLLSIVTITLFILAVRRRLRKEDD
jgi:hypothetical protein